LGAPALGAYLGARPSSSVFLPSWILFQLGEDFGVFLDPAEKIHAQMLVRHFAAAEAQG